MDNMEDQEELQLFQTELAELDRTPVELASQMRGWGDHRPAATIVRSIQRMMAGDTSVSGEMKVIIGMMLYEQHLDEMAYGDLQWQAHRNGSWSAKASDFTLSLSPQTKGRWHISIVHKDGSSHPWPTWQNSLEAAKRKALICLGDARRHIWEYQRGESKA
jgi:hypothetical protein